LVLLALARSLLSAESKTSAWFAHYAKCFNTVELNAPFYAWPTVSTVKHGKSKPGESAFSTL
jgi:uncharacterized protein YecE (DUF72 family)